MRNSELVLTLAMFSLKSTQCNLCPYGPKDLLLGHYVQYHEIESVEIAQKIHQQSVDEKSCAICAKSVNELLREHYMTKHKFKSLDVLQQQAAST